MENIVKNGDSVFIGIQESKLAFEKIYNGIGDITGLKYGIFRKGIRIITDKLHEKIYKKENPKWVKDD